MNAGTSFRVSIILERKRWRFKGSMNADMIQNTPINHILRMAKIYCLLHVSVRSSIQKKIHPSSQCFRQCSPLFAYQDISAF